MFLLSLLISLVVAFTAVGQGNLAPAQKGLPTMEDAKQFVESFRPWELYEGAVGMTVEPEVRPELTG